MNSAGFHDLSRMQFELQRAADAFFAGFEDRRASARPVDGRAEQQTDFVHHPGLQERTVHLGAALQQQGTDLKLLVQFGQHRLQVNLVARHDQVRHAGGCDLGEMCVGGRRGQHDDDVPSIGRGTVPVQPRRAIDGDRIALGRRVGDVPRSFGRRCRLRTGRGAPGREVFHRGRAREPGVGGELVVQALVLLE